MFSQRTDRTPTSEMSRAHSLFISNWACAEIEAKLQFWLSKYAAMKQSFYTQTARPTINTLPLMMFITQ